MGKEEARRYRLWVCEMSNFVMKKKNKVSSFVRVLNRFGRRNEGKTWRCSLHCTMDHIGFALCSWYDVIMSEKESRNTSNHEQTTVLNLKEQKVLVDHWKPTQQWLNWIWWLLVNGRKQYWQEENKKSPIKRNQYWRWRNNNDMWRNENKYNINQIEFVWW